MKNILKSSFYQLLVIYVILIVLISFKLIFKYTLHFEIFALILALLSLFLIKQKEQKINKSLIIIPVILILLIRILPYINNPIPLGYDPGIYKFAIEGNQAKWIYSTFEPGFLVFIDLLKNIFTINQLLIPFFIFLTLLLGLIIYITTKKFFNQDIAILSTLIYSISIIQFKVFSYFYYRNVLALILLLLTFYLIKSNNKFFVLTAAFLGGIHRPTFLIFALSFIVYTLISKDKIKNIISGILIILLTIPFYLDNFQGLILQKIEPLITANIGAGTFINFFQYQFSTLIYLPFALIGFIYLIKNKQFNLLAISFIILAIIVYFKLIFFNRFLIHLDILMIILAGYGLYIIIESKKNLGIILTTLLIISGIFIGVNESISAKPLINQEELNIISNLEPNSYTLVTDSYYAPWVLGYSNTKTIAPGLFDYNKWDFETWQKFWNSNSEEAIKMLKDYEKPLYIFIGRNQYQNLTKFNHVCFNKVLEQNRTFIYKFEC